jgi:hypothetical protein
MAPPPTPSATHLVFDSFAPERLQHLGARNVLRAYDALLVGPSRRDPREHAEARAAFWGFDDDSDELRSSHARLEPPIIVWVSSNLNDRVNLWRTCSRLRRARVPSRDALVIELGPTPWRGQGPPPQLGCHGSVIDHPDEELLARLGRARPLRPARYDRAVSLWDKYVDPNLLRFARACKRGVRGFAELASLREVLSMYLPRRTAQGTLRLSVLDEALLSLLSEGDFRTPVALFVQKSPAGEAFRELSWCTGDLIVPRRLDDWATFGSTPAVERAVGTGSETPMTAWTYRLTSEGQRLRTQGIDHLAAAPRFPVAGAMAYAPESPWVVLDDGTLSRQRALR